MSSRADLNMSAVAGPDDVTDAIGGFLADVRRRVQLRELSRAVFIGGAALLVVVIVAALSGATGTVTLLAALLAAALGLAGWLAMRAADWREPALLPFVESRQPRFRNLLVTARELIEHPERAAPAIRERVIRDAAAIASDTPLDTIVPARETTRAALGAALVLIGAVAAWYGATWWHARNAAERAAAATAGRHASASAATRSGAAALGRGNITAIVTPPGYAGRPVVTLRNPTRIEAMAGSRLHLDIEIAGTSGVGGGAHVSFNDRAQAVTRASNERVSVGMPLMENGVLSVVAQANAGGRAAGGAPAAAATSMRDRNGTEGDGGALPAAAPLLIAVSVVPDLPPVVELTAPGRDLLFDDDTARVEMAARARDDLGLQSLELHYTKVSGSGERYEFHEGQLPIAVSRRNAREWQGTLARTIRELELSSGDLLVYYAVATDGRAAGGHAVSDSYVIEIGKAGAAIAGGFAIPPDEERFAISLNALIQKTEKLHARRTAMPRAEFSDAALALAVEQRMVRTEFLFTMGFHGHVEDEMVEAEHSHEIQEGRLENRGQAEMGMATRLMTRAEQQLTAADTAEALKAQRGALAAVQRALSRHRYFLRTLPVAGEIDLTRRLTGDLSTASSARWPASEKQPDERGARIRQILNDLARLTEQLGDAEAGPSSSPASSASATSATMPSRQASSGPASSSGSAAAPARATDRHITLAALAAAVAARVLALDPSSMSLQTASAGLMQAGQHITAGRNRDARPLLRQAADAVLPLARPAGVSADTPASATPAPSPEPALRGAVVDALRDQRRLP